MAAKSAEPKNRLENIMQVDTASLLQELTQLEAAFTDYQRQDIIPGWATSILPRLEFLEKVSNGGRRSTAELELEADGDVATLKQLAADDELCEKIRHEVESRTKALKLAFDSKTSAAALEIDRLHKLLYIRPTTSELQQVVYSVQQVSKKADNVIKELGDEIQGIVATKISDEMQSLSDRQKATEEHADRAVEVVVGRVDDVESELRRVRQGISSEMSSKEQALDGLQAEAKGLQSTADALRGDLTALDKQTKESLDDLSKAQELANEQFTDFETSTNERVEILEENIAACDEIIREEVARADERYDELQQSITSLSEGFEAFRLQYESDMSAMRSTQDAISELLDKTANRQNTIFSYIESLQQFEVTAKITKNADGIDAIRRENELLEESINGVRLSVVEVKKELLVTNEELSDVPNKINVETLRIDVNRKEIGQLKESLKYTKTMMQDQQNQLEDLSLLKEQMMIVKDVCETQDDRLKKVLRNIGEVSENAEAQDRRIDEVVQGIEISEERLLAKLSATKRAIDENISQQHAEVEAKVQVLKDNVAICMAGMGGGGKKISTIAVPAKTNSARQDSAERVQSMVDSFDESRPTSAPQSMIVSSTNEKIELIAVPQVLPSALCADLAAVSQALAAILAETADAEIIQRSIKGDPSSISYEDPVTDRRGQLVDEVMMELQNKLVEINPGAGAVKLEARDLFLTRFYNALQLSLSRHDQVLATGSTRLGRLKIPSCIACDRPLVSKVGRDSLTSAAHGGRAKTPGGGVNGGPSWSSQTAPYTTGMGNPIGASMSTAGGGNNLSRASSFANDMGGTGGYLENSMSDDLPPNWKGKAVRLPSTSDERDGQSGKLMSKSQDFVLRAGFKMPKPGNYQPPAVEGRVQLPMMPHPSST